ncbi:uncharacterized protein LOC141684908 [Apium graveolens]|uniref:uncharacterized protein LOC141684908 n=1 Tax=Apium graveolens TaxID=4045 RepID=UPI003D7BF0AD
MVRAPKFWQVPWLPCANNGYLTSEKYPELADVTVDSLFDAEGRNWDGKVLNDLCNERDKTLIYQVPIPMRSKNDSCYWLPENKGKVSNFLWRVARDVLPTAVGLITKQVAIPATCTWCHTYAEDAAHILFKCCFAQELWESTGLGNIVFAGSVDTTTEVLKWVFTTARTDQCALVGLFCWGLWSRRNKWVWKRINMSIFGVKTVALNMLADWNQAQTIAVKSSDKTITRNSSWCKPP